MLDVILKRFEKPDEIRVFPKGKFELLKVGGMTIGRATYQPGWKWSVHVGAAIGVTMCQVEHVGMVVSGNGGWPRHRDEGRRCVLHRAGTRQLGRGKRAVRVSAFYGCREICCR